jgi:citrate lyase subunit beta/citryl-CoA lyase
MWQVSSEVFRSFLFVPATSKRFVNKAIGLETDAVILDLEASIPHDQKEEARGCLCDAVEQLRQTHKTVLVRVNPGNLKDCTAAMEAQADGIVVPTVEQPEDLLCFSSRLDQEKGLFPIIETPLGLVNLPSLLATDLPVGGLMFGSEDFVVRMGSRALPCRDLLFNACWQLAVHARAQGITPYGIPGTLADFSETERFREICEQGRRIGMAGCPAIHPGQLSVLNEVFSPSDEELAVARRAVEAFIAAGERAIAVDGRMVDYPIYERYRELLES